MMTIRKMLCLLVAAVLCLSLAVPGFAAENGFVPSITYKPDPEIVPVAGDYLGVIRDRKGDILDYIDENSVCVTPLANIWDAGSQTPEEIADLLRSVYEKLNDGSMELPYEKFNANLDPDDMVIRDLLDISWVSEAQRKLMEEEGATLEMTFDLGVAADEQVYVMTYDETTGEWYPIAGTVNNGDGTVTCTFDRLCVVAFSTSVADDGAEPEKPENANPLQALITSVVRAVADIVADFLDWIRKFIF